MLTTTDEKSRARLALGPFDPAALGVRVREERFALDLTQAQLAERAGMTRSSLCLVETGKTTPSLSTLYYLSKALGTSADALLGLTPCQK